MKILFLLLFPFVSVCQTDTIYSLGSVSGTDVKLGGVWMGNTTIRQLGDMDTVKCIMFCSDTATHYADQSIMSWRNNGGFYMYGYEVLKWVSDQWNESHWWQLVTYLDENKKPFKYFIWLSQQTK